VPLPVSLAAFLGAFGCPVLPMGYESAELCKMSINMFLASSVSTTNMLAELCEAVGAEWREIAPALRLDRRIGPDAYLTPGLGIGGGNLPRDMATVKALAGEHGVDAGLVAAWYDHSAFRRDWVLRTLHRTMLSTTAEPRLGLWGLSYKEHTQSVKNSPAVHLIRHLDGVCVCAYDPAADFDAASFPRVTRASSALEACRGADALAVMTPWPEFGTVDLPACVAAMRGRVLIDPFGVIDASSAREAGFLHFRLGTGAPRGVAEPC